ncbi:hypothetical protein KBD34_02695 [Patescibacteria group bacterium]|nr:hypothetical protein [Patescibacteria group bacterium]
MQVGDKCLVLRYRVTYYCIRVLVTLDDGLIDERGEMPEEMPGVPDLAAVDLAGAVGVYLLTALDIVLDPDRDGPPEAFERSEEGPVHFAPGTTISTFDDFVEKYPWDKREIQEARESAVEGSQYVARIPQSVITGKPSKDFIYLECQKRDRVLDRVPLTVSQEDESPAVYDADRAPGVDDPPN